MSLMPRIARAIAVGYPHHVIQRGNNRERVFFEDEDKDKYLDTINSGDTILNFRLSMGKPLTSPHFTPRFPSC